MKTQYTQFQGMRPAVDPRRLEPAEAIDTTDGDLRYITVNPFRAPDPDTLSGVSTLDVGTGDNVEHISDFTHWDPQALIYPEGLYTVKERGICLAPSAVSRDAYSRTYFTRPAGGMYDIGLNAAGDAFEERPTGIAAPVFQATSVGDYLGSPILEKRTGTNLGFTINWSYQIERFDPDDPAVVVASNLIPAADVYDVVLIDSYLGYYFLNYMYKHDTTSASHPMVAGGYSLATHRFIMTGEMFSDGGRYLGKVIPTPSPYSIDTDAYISGTLAVMNMKEVQPTDANTPDAPESPGWPIFGALTYDVAELKFDPSTDETSRYRSYVFTYLTNRGEESAPSAPTEPQAVLPSQTVNLSIWVGFAPDNAEKVRIYRTETTDSGTAFFYVDEVLISSKVGNLIQYEDEKMSADLPGDVLPTLNWAPPPSDLMGLVLSTKGFYVGFSGSQLYLSEPNLAYAWPDDYKIDFTGQISHIARYGDEIAVFTDREIALITGHTPLEVRKIKVEGFELLTSIYSTTEMNGLLYFVCPTGIAALSGANVAIVSDDIISERYWRDNIDVGEARLDSFDNTLYLLSAPSDEVEVPPVPPVPPEPVNEDFVFVIERGNVVPVALPLVSGFNYDFNVDWGDGSDDDITAWDQAETTHAYADDVEYTVTITGTMEAWRQGTPGSETIPDPGGEASNDFATTMARQNLLRVDNIGNTGLLTCEGMFAYSWKLTHVAGDANFSLCTSLRGMFKQASDSLVSIDLADWDVSMIQDFSKFLDYILEIDNNPDFSQWDTSSATNMESMFSGYNDAVLQPDVTNWDVSNVTNFYGMFEDVAAMNPNVSLWQTTSATNMESMFFDSPLINPDVTNWDVSKVTTIYDMFDGATSADPDVRTWVLTVCEDAGYFAWGATGWTTYDVPAAQFWNNVSITSFNSAFTGAVNIGNYASIPGSWI